MQKHHQIAFALAGGPVAKQTTQQGDVAEQWHLIAGIVYLIIDKSAQHQSLPVFHQYRSFD